ncbi:MAG TPA: DJ-1/PfpI family protein [Candidatus Polarisedimenticolia bacterium]|nr:DJ-1/PfpI family protein [Candidatus Polarisedimenticolia bacterium]
MKRTMVMLVALLALTGALAIVSFPAAGQDGREAPLKHYVCKPCGSDCDAQVFDKPGQCPHCGMPLVEQSAREAAEGRAAVAILVFNGVQIIDYTGPYEVFGQGGYRVFTVAEEKKPLRTAMGMTVVPEYAFADAPKADILVVPGGDVSGPTGSAATIAWVKERSASATQTLSVCNGAFILAKAGLLDGLSATTFAGLIDDLRAAAPKTRVVSDQRFVDNGRIVTAAGLSSGIDGALHVVEKLKGLGTAQATAVHMEYDWRPDSGYARAALADRLLPDLDLGDGSSLILLRTRGDRNNWNVAVAVEGPLTPQAILAKADEALTQAHWSKGKTAATAHGTASDWSRRGAEIGSWTGRLTLEPDTGKEGRYVLAMTIKRAA